MAIVSSRRQSGGNSATCPEDGPVIEKDGGIPVAVAIRKTQRPEFPRPDPERSEGEGPPGSPERVARLGQQDATVSELARELAVALQLTKQWQRGAFERCAVN